MTRKREQRRPPQAQQVSALEEFDQQPQEPRYPIQQSAAFAGNTLALGSLIDLFAHPGPTGLFLSDLASYVAWRHGPELAAYLRGNSPQIPCLRFKRDSRGPRIGRGCTRE